MWLGAVGLVVLVLLGIFAGRSVAAARQVTGARAKRRRLGRDEMLAASLGAILVITLVPVGGSNQVELAPLAHPSLPNAIGNVLLFVPLGVVLSLRRWGGTSAVLAGLALSASIEIAQLLIPGRTTSTADVIWNTLGAAAGWTAAASAWRRVVGR
jgi:glycopeptide antibiotics resistance protein